MAESDLDAKKGAALAAREWLALIDAGDYAPSWREAAAYLRNAVTLEDWERSLRAFRAPLGALQSRDVGSETYATSLPGAPDGDYVVVQFESSFEKKKSAVETVTPMLEADGHWRVAGYFIR